MVDFLTGLRPVGELRMILGFVQRQRAGMRRHVADQALADAQAGPVHRGLQKALRREQFKYVAGPQKVNRADFRHHVAGDDGDHLVQARLRVVRSRHHITKAAKQQSRSDPVRCVSHYLFPTASCTAFERS